MTTNALHTVAEPLLRLGKLAVASMWTTRFSIFLPSQNFTLCPWQKPAKAGSFTPPTRFFKSPIYFPIATANRLELVKYPMVLVPLSAGGALEGKEEE